MVCFHTYTAYLAVSILENVCLPVKSTNYNVVTVCSDVFPADLKALVQHITGAIVPRKKSIKVDLMEDDYGTIVAVTCGNTIVLPQGVFTSTDESFQEFCMAMHAVTAQPVGTKSFNTV